MARYETCTKCGWSQVYDTFTNICNRCNYDTKSPTAEQVNEYISKPDWRDSHDFVMESWIPEPEMKKEEIVEQDCFMCGYQFDPSELTKVPDGLICDKCMYEDEVESEESVAIKHDETKLRYDLIPADVMEAYAKVLTFGANKYAARNWEKGFKYSRVFGALMRHMWAWWSGEHRDDESGMSHLDHALFNIGALIYFDRNYKGEDDRPI